MNTNNTDEIKLKLYSNNKSGVIASLHLLANKFDVKVKDNLVSRVSRDRSRVIVIFEGSLNSTLTEFTHAIESHSRIYSIDEIEVKPNLSIFSDDKSEPDDEVYTDENTDFETIVREVEDLDFESIVREVEDIEFDSDSDSTEYKDDYILYESDSDTSTELDDDFEPESDQNFDSENLAESETLDTMESHYNANSSLKVSNEIIYKFNANDNISDESLEITEQILIDLLGPVASLFVSTAVIEANSMGELFILLSEELDGEVKSNFLGLVKGIDKSQLELN